MKRVSAFFSGSMTVATNAVWALIARSSLRMRSP
jgi:hypothetical protein